MKTRNNRSLRLLMLAACWTLYAGAAPAQKIMTLQECVAAAQMGNVKAKDARNDILMAKEQQRYARSKYFPTLGASGTHFQSTSPLIKLYLFDNEDIDYFSEELEVEVDKEDFAFSFLKKGTSMGMTLVEPIYTGGRLTSYNKLADLQVEARQMLNDVTDDQIVQNTEFLYYKILELHETDKTLDAMEKELANIHQDAVNIYENGLVNKNDVLSVELMQDQLSALRIKTGNGCTLLRRALAKYMGMADEDIDVDTTLDAEIVAPELLRMDAQSAMENRTETRLLDIWVEKSELERKIARASMLPVLGVGGSFNYSKLIQDWRSRAVGFVGLQMPLSSFWSERHEYKRKKIEVQKAQDFRQDKRELITLQILDAYDNLESTYKQTQIAEKSIVRAEENLRINREYYRNGLTTMSVLLDAQRQHQQALTQHNAAVSEYLQAKTKYLILTGRRNY